jgi:hypothetical protein
MTHFLDTPCWDQNQVGRVINRQALNIDDDLFLAIHTPFNYLEFANEQRALPEPTETALLTDLQRSARENRHAFVAIQGIPGTGKSNLIRWLYLRYLSERDPSERVLLIQRADNSLRNTLLRVLEIFKAEGRFQHERQLIERANTQLEGRSLLESILSSFHTIAVRVLEKQYLSGEPIASENIIENTPGFLLDQTVRAHLIKVRIEAIARQLVGAEERPDEMPEFEPDDFRLDIAALRSVRLSNYAEVRDFADELYDNELTRRELANYLNRLMSDAIGSTLALTPADLKRMFAELRKELRSRGETLVLFIEDITAFSGLDAGLVDVLADEHGGRDDICRLQSVIGITDYYYNVRFPDNMKDRLTLRVILPPPKANTSFLLDLAARHLNAMRVSPPVLTKWAQYMTSPDTLPNACATCPARPRCHPAFSAIPLGGDDNQTVGLFPFNEQALLTMYGQLPDDQGQGKTPRAFLRDVLGFVLETHGPAVLDGSFPPAPDKVGSAFQPPPLRKPSQRNLLRSLTPRDQKRIESLIGFWGDGTLDEYSADGMRIISGLSPTVFEAFRLPTVTGEYSEAPAVVQEISPASRVTAAQEPVMVKRGKYFEEIELWLTTGAKLRSYGDLTKSIVNFVRDAIDWDAHHVPPALRGERLVPSRFYIDGQSAKQVSGVVYTLRRETETAQLLHALDELGALSLNLPPELIGAHVATLAFWLQKHEQDLIAFVCRPDENSSSSPFEVVDLLAALNIWGLWLAGNLPQEINTVDALYFALVKHSRLRWKLSDSRTDLWKRLSQGMERYYLGDARTALTLPEEFLQALNQRQGEGKVAFLDADFAFAAIERTAFQLTTYDFDGLNPSKGTLWEIIGIVHAQFSQYLQDVIEGEFAATKELYVELSDLAGSDAPVAIFRAINEVVEAVRVTNRAIRFTVDSTLNATRLKETLRDLKHGVTSEDLPALIWISDAAPILSLAMRLRDYLREYVTAVNSLQQSLSAMSGTQVSDAEQEIVQMTSDFNELLRRLDSLM